MKNTRNRANFNVFQGMDVMTCYNHCVSFRVRESCPAKGTLVLI